MLRLFLTLNLLLLNTYACKGGYDSCKDKIKDSKTIQDCSLYIPVNKNQRLVYSKIKPSQKIIKHDPFLNLYLIEDKKGFKHPFKINMQTQLGYASVNATDSIEGKIIKKQIGLNSLAVFSEPIVYPSILTSSCCSLEAIVTPDGIIEKEYLKRFISSVSADYSDIGVRVKDDKGYIIVSASNPYREDNLLKIDDCILAYDGVKMKSSAEFMRRVLFSKIGTTHSVKIKRGKKVMTLSAVTTKRDGGGEISDTFLEFSGIYFNKKLEVVKLSENFTLYGLKLGDRLIQVHGIRVANQEELRKYIQEYKDFSALLFERENFEFFVNIK